jgi:predicted RecA/RadA family phage recombinase
MGLTQFPNGITSMGSPLTSGSYLTTGSVFYVDSNTGSDDNTGTEPTKAVATLRKAVTLCTSGLCDTIFLMPNHAETVSSSTGAHIIYSGVKIIGLGRGENRPTFTFDTTVSACIAVSCSAHSVWIENILLKSGIDALAHVIVSAASEVHIVNCEYQQVGAYEAAKVIEITSDARRATIDGFVFKGDTDAGGTQMDTVIKLAGPNKCEVKNCFIMAQTCEGVISSTSAGSTEIKPSWIHHNYIESTSSDICVQWSTANLNGGFLVLSDNIFKIPTNSGDPLAVGTSAIWSFNNLTVNVDGESGGHIDLAAGATS